MAASTTGGMVTFKNGLSFRASLEVDTTTFRFVSSDSIYLSIDEEWYQINESELLTKLGITRQDIYPSPGAPTGRWTTRIGRRMRWRTRTGFPDAFTRRCRRPCPFIHLLCCPIHFCPMSCRSTLNAIAVLSCLPWMASCSGQTGSREPQVSGDASSALHYLIADTTQLSEYIVAAFEDSKGNLWFGTVGEGVARYDGKALTYFTTNEGLIDNVVPGIAEDKAGNLWFGTHAGASRWDGKAFTNFGREQGLTGMGCKILVDRSGTVWAGTNDGAFRLEGERFIPFDLPIPVIDKPSHKWVKGKVWALLEDSKGNIWFGRDGYGACRFDGSSFTHFTKADGLCSNNVASIVEDAQGNIWFGSITSDFPKIKEGGVARYDGKRFTRFTDVKGLTESDMYMVFAERSGMVWVCPVGVGAYRYDGKTFTLFDRTERPHLTRNFGAQAVLEDSKGTLWFGFSGGLFRFDGTMFRNVTKGGPWPSR